MKTALVIKQAPFVLACLAACLLASRAQDATPAPPAGPTPPYVGALKGDYVFTKKFTYKEQQETSNQTQEQKNLTKFLSRFPIIEEMDSAESGDLRQDKRTYKNGTSVEIWRAGNFRLSVYSSTPDSVSVSPVVPGENQDAPDFAELNWIKVNLYQGEQDQQGKPCYVYKMDDQTAWIDKSTKLPVYFESKSMQVSYTYKEPASPLQLPDKFARKLQEVNRTPGGTN